MTSIINTYLKLPPLKEEISKTGDLSIRCVSKEFKKMFDSGLSQNWRDLKRNAASSGLVPLILYMNRIESLNGACTEHNSLRFFQSLKDVSLILSRKQDKLELYVNPSPTLPTRVCDFVQIKLKCSPASSLDDVLEKADEIKAKIKQLEKLASPGVPVPFYLDFKMFNIMTSPMFSSQDLSYKITDVEGTLSVYEHNRSAQSSKKARLYSSSEELFPWESAICRSNFPAWMNTGYSIRMPFHHSVESI
jgi:hypothetical protein